MRALIAVLSVVLTTGLAACAGGGGQKGAATCADVSGSNHAYVVVVHSGGRAVDRCVGFEGASITGLNAMRESGLKFTTQDYGSLGAAFCSIDNEPAHYSACLPANSPYWSDWLFRSGRWASVTTPFSKVSVGPGGALGWVYTSPTGSPAPPPRPPST